MKDPVHHLKNIQKKVIQSSRKEGFKIEKSALEDHIEMVTPPLQKKRSTKLDSPRRDKAYYIK